MGKQYLFAIKKPASFSMGYVKIVPKDHWNNHHTEYHGYIPDKKLADSVEDLGFIECMENTFEFKLTEYSIDEVIKLISSLGNLEYCKEFEDFITQD